MTTSTIWSDGFVSANQMSFHYWTSGSAPTLSSSPASALPLLILIHGFFLDAAWYLPYFAAFTKNFTLIIPDCRGMGLSSPIPKGTFNMENLVSDSVTLIQHFSPKAPVFLAGHSMGGAIAARIAQRYPLTVKALLLIEPPWNRLPGEPVSLSGYIAPEQPLDCQYNHDFIVLLQSLTTTELKAMDTETVLPPAQTTMEAFRMLNVKNISVLDMKKADVLITMAVGDIRVPVLLQVGDPATANSSTGLGSKINPALAEKMVSSYPQGTLYFVKNGTHFLFEEPTTEDWFQSAQGFLFSFLTPNRASYSEQ